MRTITPVVVHPSRLFAEGLKRILDGTPFKPVWLTLDLQDVPPKLIKSGRPLLFIVGSKNISEMKRTVGVLLQHAAAAQVVVIGDCAEPQTVVAALHAGACGYLQEGMSCEALVKALDLVMQGETVVPADIIKGLPRERDVSFVALPPAPRAAPAQTQVHDDRAWSRVSEVPARFQSSGPKTARSEAQPASARGSVPTGEKGQVLSSREAEILQCLVRGASNKDIARNLDMAEATVKVHLKAILRKIRVKNRTQAAIWAIGNLTSNNGSGSSGRREPN